MTRWTAVVRREGLAQMVAALAFASGAGGFVVATSWDQSQIAGRLAIGGVALFVLALTIGSPHLVGATTVPMLGSALMASGAGSEPAWVRSIVLGCLWYVAAELAWDAIERRDGCERSREFGFRRTNEVATVVVLSLGVTTVGFLLSFLAPTRSMVAAGAALLGLVVALNWGSARLQESSS